MFLEELLCRRSRQRQGERSCIRCRVSEGWRSDLSWVEVPQEAIYAIQAHQSFDVKHMADRPLTARRPTG